MRSVPSISLPKIQWTSLAFLFGVTLLAMFLGLIAAVMDSVLVMIVLIPLIPIALVLRDYRAGIFFLAFVLPFANSPFLPKFPGFNIVGYLALATACVFAFRHLNQLKVLARPPVWLFSLYILPLVFAVVMGLPHIKEVPNYMVLTEAFAQETPSKYVKSYFVYPMVTVVWAWMMSIAFQSSDRPQRYIWLLFASALLPAIVQLGAVAFLGTAGVDVDTLASTSQGSTRSLLSISGFHANEMGILLSSIFGPLLFVAASAKKASERFLLWGILMLVTLALLLTFSRGAYVSAAIIVGVFLFRARGSKMVKTFIILTILSMAIALGGALVVRISEGWSGSASSGTRADAVTASRTIIWNAVLPELYEHPILGNGLRSTAWSNAAKSSIFPTHPHNLYMEIALDMGLVGLILICAFFAKFVLLLRRASRTELEVPLVTAYLEGATVALIGYLVSSIANGHSIPTPETTYLWASFGIALGVMARKSTFERPAQSARLSRQGV